MLTTAPATRTAPVTGVRALWAPAAVAAGAALSCAVIWWGDPTTPGGPLPVCPTKLLLGIDCPGCGSLRMIYSLLHADLGAALRFNAVALVTLPLLAWAWVTWTRGRWRGRRVESWQHRRWAPMIALVITVAWWVVRNIPVEPFTHLRV
ncbi:MAG TPA: DUF2752 domain-containing protein [Pseudonocardiaceae bacterium]